MTTEQPIQHDEHGSPVYFDAILRPNRSLSPRGFRLLMLAFGAMLFGVGGWFFMVGAWPVFGFMGLEIGLVYWCFKHN